MITLRFSYTRPLSDQSRRLCQTLIDRAMRLETQRMARLCASPSSLPINGPEIVNCYSQLGMFGVRIVGSSDRNPVLTVKGRPLPLTN
jgi:hypothetical protein